ncbi:unnamed protein product [Rhodiola kirilowii]
MRYVKGDKVEVLSSTLEYSWHPARIVEGDGDAFTVMYDGHVNGMVVEVVLVKYIRPRPPVVDFSDWSRGDLVHVYDNFAWKLAAVLQVLDNKQFLVRVVGAMLDLNVGAARIRVRHYWKDNQWTIVGKGPSISDVKRPLIRYKLTSDSEVLERNTNALAPRRITRQKSRYVPTNAIKRSAPSTLDQTEAWRKSAKLSKTIEKSSPCTLNQTDACTGTGMRSRLTEELQGRSGPPAPNSTLNKAHEKHEDSRLSSVGSCSMNTDSSNHQYPTKYAKHGCSDESVSDAESCNVAATPKPGNQPRIFVLRKRRQAAALDRSVQRRNLVLRFRQQGSSLQDPHCRDGSHQAPSSSSSSR